MSTWGPVNTTGDCNPWGQTGKHSVNSGSNQNIFIKRTMTPGDTTDKRRGMMSFDLDAFPGASGDITSASIDFYITGASSSGDSVGFEQIDPQCSHPSPASDQASHFDAAECDWLEMSADASDDWINPGGDVFGANNFTAAAPTSTGTWTVSHANLGAMCAAAIDSHGGDLLLSIKWASETTGGDENMRIAAIEHTTQPEAALTISYTTGAVGTPIHYFRRFRG